MHMQDDMIMRCNARLANTKGVTLRAHQRLAHRPSRLFQDWSLVLVSSFVFFVLQLLCFYAYPNLLVSLLISVASDSAIAGWAESLHNVYTTIGGYLISLGLFLFFDAHVSYVFVFI
jgi:hypothetical protein